ncbi:MAG: cysteine desulfurase [Ignavibacteriales bacterium]|nr:cysteine desulfurase [Ignavibacteriales bacterium]
MNASSTIVRMRGSSPSFDVERIRRQFPILQTKVRGKRLVYLDSAATSQKPTQVLDAIRNYYTQENSNVHRGVHFLSELATQKYEAVREKVRRFINAATIHEIVFVRGTTEAINLVAQSFGRSQFTSGDEIVVSAMEHHSNIVPWQLLGDQVGTRLRVIPMTDEGELRMDEFVRLLNPKTRLVAITHVSNALGTINLIQEMVSEAHRRGIVVLVDGAQAVPHIRVDVQTLGADFYAFSGHKMFGPTGIGVLYGKQTFLESMPPYQAGGDMIKSVTFEKTIFNDLPYKFEAGTPNIEGAIGLGAAIDFMESLDWPVVEMHEQELLQYAQSKLVEIPNVKLVGTARLKSGVLSFTLDGVHPHDIGTILDQEGVAIRTGHHCAQPVMERFGIPATARASIALYNTFDDIDALVQGIHVVKKVFGV